MTVRKMIKDLVCPFWDSKLSVIEQGKCKSAYDHDDDDDDDVNPC